jgi:hypothetical protein
MENVEQHTDLKQEITERDVHEAGIDAAGKPPSAILPSPPDNG